MNRTLAAGFFIFFLFAGCGDDNPSSPLVPEGSTPVVYQLRVPLDYNEPGGLKMLVEYGIHRARNGVSKGQILFLHGGPGANIFGIANAIASRLPELHNEHDLVFFNIRGVGEHALEAGCISEDSEDPAEQLSSCFEDADNRVPLWNYTSRNAARDVQTLCDALDCGTWRGVWANSYGTRVIQEMLRLNPDSMERFVMDSVVAPDHEFSEESPRARAQLEKVFADCESEASCMALLPEGIESYEAALETLLESYREPIVATVTDEDGTSVDATVLSSERAVAVLRLLVESDDRFADIPRFVASGAEPFDPDADPPINGGRFFALTMLEFSNFSGAFSSRDNGLVNNIMVCNEFVRFDQPDIDELEERGGIFGTDGYESQLEVCPTVWDLIPDDRLDYEPTPVQVEQRGCLLSGEDDLVTPVAPAQEVADGITGAQHITFPFTGHGAIGTSCGTAVTQQCLDADLTSISDGCTDTLSSPYTYDEMGFPALEESLFHDRTAYVRSMVEDLVAQTQLVGSRGAWRALEIATRKQ